MQNGKWRKKAKKAKKNEYYISGHLIINFLTISFTICVNKCSIFDLSYVWIFKFNSQKDQISFE